MVSLILSPVEMDLGIST